MGVHPIQIIDMLNARPSHHGYFMVINMLATEGGKNPIIRPEWNQIYHYTQAKKRLNWGRAALGSGQTSEMTRYQSIVDDPSQTEGVKKFYRKKLSQMTPLDETNPNVVDAVGSLLGGKKRKKRTIRKRKIITFSLIIHLYFSK